MIAAKINLPSRNSFLPLQFIAERKRDETIRKNIGLCFSKILEKCIDKFSFYPSLRRFWSGIVYYGNSLSRHFI